MVRNLGSFNRPDFMSKSLLIHYFREIEQAEKSIDLVPISQDVQQRKGLSDAERAQLLAKINERINHLKSRKHK